MAKYKSNGTKLQYLEDDGTTYTDVAQISDVGPPSQSGDSIDATTHDSVGSFREFVAGLRDAGDVPLSIVHDPEDTASQAKLLEFFNSGEMRTWRVVFPTANNAHWQFSGFVNEFGGETPLDDKIMANCTIKVSGRPTLTPNPS